MTIPVLAVEETIGRRPSVQARGQSHSVAVEPVVSSLLLLFLGIPIPIIILIALFAR